MANEQEANDQARLAEARAIVQKFCYYSGGFSLVPIPLFNLAVVGASQLSMISGLCKLYGVEFSRKWGKYVLTSLIGGYAPLRIAQGGIGALIGAVPLVGPVASVLTMPAFAYASTYAVGMVFVKHLESGGTLLSLDPTDFKEHFVEQYEKGKLAVGQLTKKKPGSEKLDIPTPA